MLKILLFVLVVAVAIYAITRLVERRGGMGGMARPRREPPRIVAPDDDPEFLRDLDRKKRQKDEPESPA